jgi:predicted membrane-bound spermidine synthase
LVNDLGAVSVACTLTGESGGARGGGEFGHVINSQSKRDFTEIVLQYPNECLIVCPFWIERLPMRKTLLFSLAFIAGFSIMAIELLAGRILSPYFGGSVYVWGSIITIFMLALSIGYLLGGRWSLDTPNLNRFGALFLLATIFMLPIAWLDEPILNYLSDLIEDPRYGSLMASMVLFTLPTVILGMISPYAIRLLIEAKEASGQTAGRLYFVSTFGSAVGTLMTSFYLVLWLGIRQIIILICTLLFIGGLSALIFAKTRGSE